MELTDPIWQNLKGAYKRSYDVSIPLRKLEQYDSLETVKNIWEELWNQLHHQGDVGLASYLAVPHLVRIGIKKNLYNWNLIGLCVVIEQQRYSNHNPELPEEYENYYFGALKKMKEFVISNLNYELDRSTLAVSLSAIATCNGNINLGKAILEMEDEDVLNEFLNQF